MRWDFEIESPCTKECLLNRDDWCDGCGRTRQEIREWSKAGCPRRLEILHAAKLRKGAADDDSADRR